MGNTLEMINRHPLTIPQSEKMALTEAIESCLNCGQVCAACSDACQGEKGVNKFRSIIRSASDSSDICFATAKILIRLNDKNRKSLQVLLNACTEQINETMQLCTQYSTQYEHCRVCSDACKKCETAITEYLKQSTM